MKTNYIDKNNHYYYVVMCLWCVLALAHDAI